MDILQLLGLGGQGRRPVLNQAQGMGQELPPIAGDPLPVGSPDPATEIVVNGSTPYDEPQRAPMGLDNLDVLRGVQEQNASAPARSGMFGVKGTLRDVIGTIGDAFLTQAGRDTVYAPRRQNERESDALAGFTGEDPAAAMAAVERLADVNPEAARELMTAIQTNQLRTAQAQSLQQSRESLINDRTDDQKERGLNRLTRLVAAGAPYPVVAAAATQYGITAEELARFGVVEGMTDEARRSFANSDMSVPQQYEQPRADARLELAERNTAATESNARSNAQRAARPPAGRAPRSQTELEYYQEISAKPVSQRTPEERAWAEDYIRPPATSRSGRRQVAPAAPATRVINGRTFSLPN